MLIPTQKDWSVLSQHIFGDLLAKHRFTWGTCPLVAYVISNWDTFPATLWASAIGHRVSVMIMYEKIDDVVSVEFSWRDSFETRIEVDAVAFDAEGRFVSEDDMEIRAQSSGSNLATDIMARYPEISQRLLFKRQLLEKYAGSLLAGNYETYDGRQRKIYEAIGQFLERGDPTKES